MKKKVAIVGHAPPSCQLVPWDNLGGDLDIWLCNAHPFLSAALNKKIPDDAFSRMYELHNQREIDRSFSKEKLAYYDNFTKRNEKLVVQSHVELRAKHRINYDFERFFKAFPSPRPDQPNKADSTVMYMIGDAILEGYGQINVYGVNLRATEEWGYQNGGTCWILGIAQGRGIEVWIHPDSELMKSPFIYALEDPPTLTEGALSENYLERRVKECAEATDLFQTDLWSKIRQMLSKAPDVLAALENVRRSIEHTEGAKHMYEFELEHVRGAKLRMPHT